jgi:hypothetical protein
MLLKENYYTALLAAGLKQALGGLELLLLHMTVRQLVSSHSSTLMVTLVALDIIVLPQKAAHILYMNLVFNIKGGRIHILPPFLRRLI